MGPLGISSFVAVLILAGATLGGVVRTRLPGHHLAEETKDMVKVGIGFLATLVALVLGLVITSAKSSFDAKVDEVHTAAAKIILLDHNLRQMGGAAEPARRTLRDIVSARVGQIWGGDGAPTVANPGQFDMDVVQLQEMLRALSPTGEAQSIAWRRSLQLADELAQMRSLAVAQAGSTITTPLLVVLMFWLVFISIGMNVFAPRNGTIYVLNLLCALSAASAIFLILEMDRPFDGLIKISDAPMRSALVELSR